MNVTVKLFATLTRNVSQEILVQHPNGIRAGSAIELDLAEGHTLGDLVALLELPVEQVKLMFVNGRAQQMAYRLKPGDQVGIFPPIGGG
jgi:molybdopterin converting factor small subunit